MGNLDILALWGAMKRAGRACGHGGHGAGKAFADSPFVEPAFAMPMDHDAKRTKTSVAPTAGKTALRTPDTDRTGQLPHIWNAELALQAARFGTVHLTKQTLENAFQLFQRLDTDGSGGLDAADMEPLGSYLCPSDTVRSTRRRKALEAIVAELRLAEADTDGNSTVDFIEFMEAFKRR